MVRQSATRKRNILFPEQQPLRRTVVPRLLWYQDKRQGKGKYTYANGAFYDGQWKDDKKWGRGKFDWGDGTLYDGEWVNNVRSGKGTNYYSDGDVYTGMWKEDMPNGKGIYKFSIGENEYEIDDSFVTFDTVEEQIKGDEGYYTSEEEFFELPMGHIPRRILEGPGETYLGETGKELAKIINTPLDAAPHSWKDIANILGMK